MGRKMKKQGEKGDYLPCKMVKLQSVQASDSSRARMPTAGSRLGFANRGKAGVGFRRPELRREERVRLACAKERGTDPGGVDSVGDGEELVQFGSGGDYGDQIGFQGRRRCVRSRGGRERSVRELSVRLRESESVKFGLDKRERDRERERVRERMP
ncbi:hypothetical protein MA16_Dca011509 [Dendrobium catenatum]|uniref:Uncharacterized protein n=1 Tax=Dendrobium catenatum TaxID=906689 RepID=A0A2I0VFL4_9ASPA|nr:hypothetical protein MA16_Dca011509 [Dendrobium catenatum]